ncbi:MAG: dihydroorotate dehydrogenase electron transfer subunit [bacterium]
MFTELIHEGSVSLVEKIKSDFVLLSVRINSKPVFQPGQFMMIQVSNSYDPLLLRPFSILDKHDDVYRFLIKIMGRGTKLISEFKVGRRLFLTGPFGNGFPFDIGSDSIVVAGGAGIASVFAFVQRLHKHHIPYELIYGAKTSDELVLLDMLKPYNHTIVTDDGSMGYHGVVTDVLKKRINHKHTIFACGPTPMLSAVKNIATRHGITCYLSLEARMACGFGVCLGCTIFDSNGKTRRVCKDGPVFRAEEVVLDKKI